MLACGERSQVEPSGCRPQHTADRSERRISDDCTFGDESVWSASGLQSQPGHRDSLSPQSSSSAEPFAGMVNVGQVLPVRRKRLLVKQPAPHEPPLKRLRLSTKQQALYLKKPFGSPSLSDRSRLSTDAPGSEGQAAEDEDLTRRSMTKEDRM